MWGVSGFQPNLCHLTAVACFSLFSPLSSLVPSLSSNKCPFYCHVLCAHIPLREKIHDICFLCLPYFAYMTISSFTDFSPTQVMSVFFTDEWNSIVCIHISIIHSSVNGHWSWFHIFAVVKSALHTHGCGRISTVWMQWYLCWFRLLTLSL